MTLLGPDPEHADWMEARLRNLTVSFELLPRLTSPENIDAFFQTVCIFGA